MPYENKQVPFRCSAIGCQGIELKLIKSGINVISNASPFRMSEDVPLINPELNFSHLKILEDKEKKNAGKCNICKGSC